MNLHYERTIAIHLPIYFEREKKLREKKPVHLENIYSLSMTVIQELDLIVIAMHLDIGYSNSITKQFAQPYTPSYFLKWLLGLPLDKGRN